MNRRKLAILPALVGLLCTAGLAHGQAKSEAAKPDRAKVLLRFAKDGAVSSRCSEELGIIEQSILLVEGVKNVKVDTKNNGMQVSYDPGKTTPQKIVVAFNKENPDALLKDKP